MNDIVEIRFSGISENEGFARICAAAFAARTDPTIEELADIKTAVSEAVTNAVIHAYPDGPGEVVLRCETKGAAVRFTVSDEGRGIEDIARAREPFYTTAEGDERSGMGFTVMETFMDTVEVTSAPRKGTTVVLEKRIAGGEDI